MAVVVVEEAVVEAAAVVVEVSFTELFAVGVTGEK